MIGSTLIVLVRIFGLTAAGFIVFQLRFLQDRVLPPIVFVTVNVLFPMYSVYSLSAGWSEATSGGIVWMAIFFVACVLTIGLQTGVAFAVVNRTKIFATERPNQLRVLFAAHNAGYIPLPILGPLVSPSVLVYMFFYVLAFQLLFWTVALSAIRGSGGVSFRLSMPLVGIVVGLVVAATNTYRFMPAPIEFVFSFAGSYAMDFILVVLGGILAGIPRHHMRFRPEFGWFVVAKMIAFPALMVPVSWLLTRGIADPNLAFGIRLALVIEAAVPPATNIMIATKQFGQEEDVRYTGTAILVTYAAAAVTLPLFVTLTLYLLR